MPRLAPAGGGAWKVVTLIVAGVMLVCAIPIVAILLAMHRAGFREGAQQGQSRPSRSTVSSASPSCLSTGAA